jgi:altronate hydrolase
MDSDKQILKLRESDNVGIALTDLDPSTSAAAAEPINRGHKIAVRNIVRGEPIIKLGQVIGIAGNDISLGCHVHVHNIDANAAPVAIASNLVEFSDSAALQSFYGFRRADGRIGTRNYIGVIATVNCSATVVRTIVNRAEATLLPQHAGIDGVVPITHISGCGMTTTGIGMELLRRTLGGFARQANFGGVLIIGLGCEANELGALLESQGLREGDRLRTMTIQAAGGTKAAIEAGLQQVAELMRIADGDRREPAPAAELILGLQCGGSDSFSAVSANPALGYAADLLVQAGGTVVLAETPEIHGAENLLLKRAVSAEVVAALKERLAWWQQYVARNDASLNNNPSPGNLAGGISTIYEKSLGAVAKSGTSRLQAVYQYAQTIDQHGFVFMDSPGYDPCSVTGEIAAGANVVCFTTGRGSVFGAKPVPSIKLATNSIIAARMADDMDFDCGAVLDGSMSLAVAGHAIFQLILEIASGQQSASEENGMGDFEFVPWQIGAVL